ncbi:MAG: hypothetical protein ACXWDU_01780, partial [Actinomycetota bacterium]
MCRTAEGSSDRFILSKGYGPVAYYAILTLRRRPRAAYPVPMTELPADVLMRLGPAPQDLTRFGSSRVLRGNGLVAKSGPAERIA